ncbi:MAG TPA: hypothetical protein P5514_13260 [Bacteroidales bacterium]|nr:hypothetical protein [Bacteroidales bacterium]
MSIFVMPVIIDGYAQDDLFEKYIIDSVRIEIPLFDSVLPGVDIIFEISQMSLPPADRVIAKFAGKKFLLPVDFNFVFNNVKDKSHASDNEIIETFIQILYWVINDGELDNIAIKKRNKKSDLWNFNFQAKFKIRDDKIKLLILFEDSQVKRVEIYNNGEKRGVISPKLLEIPLD